MDCTHLEMDKKPLLENDHLDHHDDVESHNSVLSFSSGIELDHVHEGEFVKRRSKRFAIFKTRKAKIGIAVCCVVFLALVIALVTVGLLLAKLQGAHLNDLHFKLSGLCDRENVKVTVTGTLDNPCPYTTTVKHVAYSSHAIYKGAQKPIVATGTFSGDIILKSGQSQIAQSGKLQVIDDDSAAEILDIIFRREPFVFVTSIDVTVNFIGISFTKTLVRSLPVNSQEDEISAQHEKVTHLNSLSFDNNTEESVGFLLDLDYNFTNAKMTIDLPPLFVNISHSDEVLAMASSDAMTLDFGWNKILADGIVLSGNVDHSAQLVHQYTTGNDVVLHLSGSRANDHCYANRLAVLVDAAINITAPEQDTLGGRKRISVTRVDLLDVGETSGTLTAALNVTDDFALRAPLPRFTFEVIATVNETEVPPFMVLDVQPFTLEPGLLSLDFFTNVSDTAHAFFVIDSLARGYPVTVTLQGSSRNQSDTFSRLMSSFAIVTRFNNHTVDKQDGDEEEGLHIVVKDLLVHGWDKAKLFTQLTVELLGLDSLSVSGFLPELVFDIVLADQRTWRLHANASIERSSVMTPTLIMDMWTELIDSDAMGDYIHLLVNNYSDAFVGVQGVSYASALLPSRILSHLDTVIDPSLFSAGEANATEVVNYVSVLVEPWNNQSMFVNVSVKFPRGLDVTSDNNMLPGIGVSLFSANHTELALFGVACCFNGTHMNCQAEIRISSPSGLGSVLTAVANGSSEDSVSVYFNGAPPGSGYDSIITRSLSNLNYTVNLKASGDAPSTSPSPSPAPPPDEGSGDIFSDEALVIYPWTANSISTRYKAQYHFPKLDFRTSSILPVVSLDVVDANGAGLVALSLDTALNGTQMTIVLSVNLLNSTALGLFLSDILKPAVKNETIAVVTGSAGPHSVAGGLGATLRSFKYELKRYVDPPKGSIAPEQQQNRTSFDVSNVNLYLRPWDNTTAYLRIVADYYLHNSNLSLSVKGDKLPPLFLAVEDTFGNKLAKISLNTSAGNNLLDVASAVTLFDARKVGLFLTDALNSSTTDAIEVIITGAPSPPASQDFASRALEHLRYRVNLKANSSSSTTGHFNASKVVTTNVQFLHWTPTAVAASVSTSFVVAGNVSLTTLGTLPDVKLSAWQPSAKSAFAHLDLSALNVTATGAQLLSTLTVSDAPSFGSTLTNFLNDSHTSAVTMIIRGAGGSGIVSDALSFFSYEVTLKKSGSASKKRNITAPGVTLNSLSLLGADVNENAYLGLNISVNGDTFRIVGPVPSISIHVRPFSFAASVNTAFSVNSHNITLDSGVDWQPALLSLTAASKTVTYAALNTMFEGKNFSVYAVGAQRSTTVLDKVLANFVYEFKYERTSIAAPGSNGSIFPAYDLQLDDGKATLDFLYLFTYINLTLPSKMFPADAINVEVAARSHGAELLSLVATSVNVSAGLNPLKFDTVLDNSDKNAMKATLKEFLYSNPGPKVDLNVRAGLNKARISALGLTPVSSAIVQDIELLYPFQLPALSGGEGSKFLQCSQTIQQIAYSKLFLNKCSASAEIDMWLLNPIGVSVILTYFGVHISFNDPNGHPFFLPGITAQNNISFGDILMSNRQPFTAYEISPFKINMKPGGGGLTTCLRLASIYKVHNQLYVDVIGAAVLEIDKKFYIEIPVEVLHHWLDKNDVTNCIAKGFHW